MKQTKRALSAVLAAFMAAGSLSVGASAADEIILDDNIIEEITPFDESTEEISLIDDVSMASVEDSAVYVMMNIPYAEFYKAEVVNDVEVDVFTSATKSKPAMAALAPSTYRAEDNSVIYGITYPVQCTSAELAELPQTTADAIATAGDYAYYELSDIPSEYKTLSIDGNAKVFSEVNGVLNEADTASVELTTNTAFGDYQLSVSGLFTSTDRNGNVLSEGVLSKDAKTYAVIVATEEGHSYGMRALGNLWRNSEIAWTTGFTESVHGCPASSAHYVSMMGETIDSVTFYTSEGNYRMSGLSLYVPIKFNGSVSVAEAKVSAGKTTISVANLPKDYAPVYTFSDGLNAKVSKGIIKYPKTTAPGMYTVTVSDKNGKYYTLPSASMNLTVDKVPVSYRSGRLTGKNADDVSDYLNAIAAVSVNGSNYQNASAGIISTEDGSINPNAANSFHGQTTEVFDQTGTYTLTISAPGYPTMTVTLGVAIAEDGTKTVVDLPSASKITMLMRGSKKIYVTTSKVSKASYRIQYSTSSKFTAETTKTLNSSSVVNAIKGLKKSTRYYVRVCTVKNVSGAEFCSNWSAAKSIKTP